MSSHKNVVHLSEVPLEPLGAPDGSSPQEGIPFGGFRRRVGSLIGAKKLGYTFFTVPPGKAAYPFHLHRTNEEMIYIIEGEAILRLGKDEMAVSSGTVIACPPGADHPHQLINVSTREIRYLVVSTMESPEVAEYPDSHKIGVYVTGASKESGLRTFYVKDSNVSYFEGETGSEVERIRRSGPGT